MANASGKTPALPDWWQREKQRRQLYFLIFLLAVLILIGYYYWVSVFGGPVHAPGINFDTSHYIAFTRSDKDGKTSLCVMRDDGSGFRQLTDADDKSGKKDPAWTMDGKHLLYASNLKEDSPDKIGKTWQIYLLGEGAPKQLTVGIGNKFAPISAPDGQRAAFVTQGAIKTIHLDGTNVLQIMPLPNTASSAEDENKPATDPADSLHGEFLSAAFSSDGYGYTGVKALSGEDNPTITDQGAMEDQVAFALLPDADKALVLNAGREVSVSWHPSALRLACAFAETLINADPQKRIASARREVVSGISLYDFANPKKPVAKPLLVAAGYTLEPANVAWSPDGTKIAFEVWRLKNQDERELAGIKIVNADSPPILIRSAQDVKVFLQHLELPASAGGKPQRPRWSPDGARLLYEVLRADGGHDLHLINSDGTNPLNLTKGQADDTQGAWSPVR